MAARTPSNLRAVRALARSLREQERTDPATDCMVTLAQTLAAQVDAGAAGTLPGYVLSKLSATYASVLESLAQLTRSSTDDAFTALLAELAAPTRPEPTAWQ
jgi:hypothetical protein